jgi:hypothetical protein
MSADRKNLHNRGLDRHQNVQDQLENGSRRCHVDAVSLQELFVHFSVVIGIVLEKLQVVLLLFFGCFAFFLLLLGGALLGVGLRLNKVRVFWVLKRILKARADPLFVLDWFVLRLNRFGFLFVTSGVLHVVYKLRVTFVITSVFDLLINIFPDDKQYRLKTVLNLLHEWFRVLVEELERLLRLRNLVHDVVQQFV